MLFVRNRLFVKLQQKNGIQPRLMIRQKKEKSRLQIQGAQ